MYLVYKIKNNKIIDFWECNATERLEYLNEKPDNFHYEITKITKG